MPHKRSATSNLAQAYSADGAIGGSRFLAWGWDNIPCETPLQKLLLFFVGDGMCTDGICCGSLGDLAEDCCTTVAEVGKQLDAWKADGILGLAFSEGFDRVGLIFPEFYRSEVQRVYDDRKVDALKRAAKKAAKKASS